MVLSSDPSVDTARFSESPPTPHESNQATFTFSITTTLYILWVHGLPRCYLNVFSIKYFIYKHDGFCVIRYILAWLVSIIA